MGRVTRSSSKNVTEKLHQSANTTPMKASVRKNGSARLKTGQAVKVAQEGSKPTKVVIIGHLDAVNYCAAPFACGNDFQRRFSNMKNMLALPWKRIPLRPCMWLRHRLKLKMLSSRLCE